MWEKKARKVDVYTLVMAYELGAEEKGHGILNRNNKTLTEH
jgi:hypothetical protein